MSTLTLLRGGPSSWSVVCPGIPESCQLVSIEGITSGFGFDSSITGATVTITLLDPERVLTEERLQEEAVVEYQQLYLQQKQCLIKFDGTGIWVGYVTTFNRVDDQVKLILQGELKDIDEDYSLYRVPATSPRDAACSWYRDALSYTLSGAPMPEYDDDYHRSSARVAPPAYTLGAWPEPYRYNSPHLWGFKAIEDDSGKYQKTQFDFGTPSTTPWVKISNFSPCPDGKVHSETGCRTNPILWHTANTSMYYNVRVGYTDNPTYGTLTKPADCDWMVGRDQFISIEAGRITSVSDFQLISAGVKPSETISTRVRDASIGQIIGQSITMLGTGLISGFVEASKWFHNVNQGVFEGSHSSSAYGCWSHWRSGSYPSWLSNGHQKDEFQFSDGLWGRAISGNASTWGATCDFTYVHPDTSSWSSSTVAADCVEYQWQQVFYPVTIQQEAWTREMADQAAWLDGTAFFEGARFWRDEGNVFVNSISVANLYPEKGRVFEIPLSIATASDLQWQQDNPLPKDIKCKYVDMLGRENEVVWTGYGTGSDDKTVEILQGSILKTDKSTSVSVYDWDIQPWAYTRFTRTSTSWDYGPGQLMDRYSGITYDDIDGLVCDDIPTPDATEQEGTPESWHLPNSAGEKYGIAYLTGRGTLSDAIYAPTESGMQLPGYSVRDKDGQEYNLFGQYVFLTSQFSDAVLDVSPLQMMKMASERVYAKSARPSYTVNASLCYATVNPGSVLILQMPSFDSGRPWLCLLLAKSFSSTSAGVTLTIAPMHPITDDDYNNWENLEDILSHYIFDRGEYDTSPIPAPPQPVITGTKVEFDGTTNYNGCAELTIEGITQRILARDVDTNKSLVVKMNGQIYQSNQYITTSPKNFFTAERGFNHSTMSSTTKRDIFIYCSGVAIAQTSSTNCYVFLNDALAANIPSDLEIYYNAEVTYE